MTEPVHGHAQRPDVRWGVDICLHVSQRKWTVSLKTSFWLSGGQGQRGVSRMPGRGLQAPLSNILADDRHR